MRKHIIDHLYIVLLWLVFSPRNFSRNWRAVPPTRHLESGIIDPNEFHPLLGRFDAEDEEGIIIWHPRVEQSTDALKRMEQIQKKIAIFG